MPTGGIQLTDTVAHASVPYADGLFTLPLDFGANVFTGGARWLEIEVRSATNNPAAPYVLLSPRQPLTAAPYSLHAERAALVADGSVRFAQLAPDAVGTVNLQTGAVTSAKIANGTITSADVAANTFWGATGNAGSIPGTHFLGTTDNQALELKVNNQRTVRLEPGVGSGGPNFIGGVYANTITQIVSGSFIGGGGDPLWHHSVAASGVFLGGGRGNTVRTGADYATLAGGDVNEIGANAYDATIGGGSGNRVGDNSIYSGVFAGAYNVVSANSRYAGVLLGGSGQVRQFSDFAAVLSGGGNTVGPSAGYAAIASGRESRIESGGGYAFIGGGLYNVIRTNASYAAILSGGYNTIEQEALGSVMAGGSGKRIGPSAYRVFLGGGQDNKIEFNASHSAIVGGRYNLVRSNASWSAVLGGYSSTAGAQFSIAAGHQAKAEHIGSIVLADGQYADFVSSNANEFAVRAGGGVRFVTGGSGLSVDGWKLTSGGGLQLGAESVGTTNLKSAAVTSDKIADGTVADADLSPALASNTFWRLDGNAATTAGTHFLGTTDDQPLELKVNGLRALRLQPVSNGTPNVIAGWHENLVTAGVIGATISGGGSAASEGYVLTNTIASSFGVIGGGSGNRIGDHSVFSTICGGAMNWVGTNASLATVAGGMGNEAAADYSFAAGYRAKALHRGAFVWSSWPGEASSTRDQQFLVAANGGFRLARNAGENKTVELGDRYRDNAVIAWARVSAAGEAQARFGLTSVTNIATGKYEIILDAAAESSFTLIPMAMAEVDAAPTSAASARLVSVNLTGTNAFTVYINNGNYDLVNNDFMFMVTGR